MTPSLCQDFHERDHSALDMREAKEEEWNVKMRCCEFVLALAP